MAKIQDVKAGKQDKKKKSIVYLICINVAFAILMGALFYAGHLDGKQTLCEELEGKMAIHIETQTEFCLINKSYLEQYQYNTYMSQNLADYNLTFKNNGN